MNGVKSDVNTCTFDKSKETATPDRMGTVELYRCEIVSLCVERQTAFAEY
jgi:hypothetical protein